MEKRTCETCGEMHQKYMWNANVDDGSILLTDKMYDVMLKALNHDKTIRLFGNLLELAGALSHAAPVCEKCLATEGFKIPKEN